MMTFTLAIPNRRVAPMNPFRFLQNWLSRRATAVAVDRLDDHMRRDIGLPTRSEMPLPRHDAAKRIVMMSLR